MTGCRWCVLLAALALLAAPGCKKEKSESESEEAESAKKVTDSETDNEEKDTTAEVEGSEEVANRPAEVAQRMLGASKLSATPMMAHIPANSPYVLASFEPIPQAYWEKIMESFGPVLDKTIETGLAAGARSSDKGARVAYAVLEKMRGKMSAKGLEDLGFSTSPNFAVYGVGPFPVFRFEIADGKKVKKLVVEVAKKGGVKLPKAKHEGIEYWHFDEPDMTAVVAVVGNELVGALAEPEAMKKMLPLVLGIEKPESSMADGAPLKDVVARHGFASYGVGYVDFGKLLDGAFGKTSGATGAVWGALMKGEEQPSAACQSALASAVESVPRLALGYDEVSAKTTEFTAVLEMAPALSKKLREVAVAVPGLSSNLSGKPMFVLGGGFDIGKGRALAKGGAKKLGELGATCDIDDWKSGAKDLLESLESPLPPMVEGVRGFVVAITDGQIGAKMPTNIQGYAVVAAEEPEQLLAAAKALSPMPIDIEPDGEFHKLSLPVGPPVVNGVYGAVKDKALVVAAGDGGKSRVEKELAQSQPASPIFLLAYDYGTLMKGAMSMGGAQGEPELKKLVEAQAEHFGLAAMWMYVSPKGLGFRGRWDFRE